MQRLLAIVGAMGLVALTDCVIFRPWAPQPSAPLRECVGRFAYPDSAGHCVPAKDSLPAAAKAVATW